MFECVWKYLTEVFLADYHESPPSAQEVALAAHAAYMTSRLGLYVGGRNYFHALDEHVMDRENGDLIRCQLYALRLPF